MQVLLLFFASIGHIFLHINSSIDRRLQRGAGIDQNGVQDAAPRLILIGSHTDSNHRSQLSRMSLLSCPAATVRCHHQPPTDSCPCQAWRGVSTTQQSAKSCANNAHNLVFAQTLAAVYVSQGGQRHFAGLVVCTLPLMVLQVFCVHWAAAAAVCRRVCITASVHCT